MMRDEHMYIHVFFFFFCMCGCVGVCVCVMGRSPTRRNVVGDGKQGAGICEDLSQGGTVSHLP